MLGLFKKKKKVEPQWVEPQWVEPSVEYKLLRILSNSECVLHVNPRLPDIDPYMLEFSLENIQVKFYRSFGCYEFDIKIGDRRYKTNKKDPHYKKLLEFMIEKRSQVTKKYLESLEKEMKDIVNKAYYETNTKTYSVSG